MANRNLHEPMTLDRKIVKLFGRVVFGGSGAVSSVDANGFTVTKPAGTGLYRITTEDSWPDMVGLQLELYNGGTAADVKVQRASRYNSTTKVVDFQVVGGAVAADGSSGHAVDIEITFRNTNTPKQGL